MAIWGGEKKIPQWANAREMDRFMALTFQHFNDIAERLAEYPEQFDPLFGEQEMEGQLFTVVEDWCYGYMRGVALDADWRSCRLHSNRRCRRLRCTAVKNSWHSVKPSPGRV